MSKKLTTKQIDAALYAIDHAEADADCDGFADRGRTRELRMGVMVLRRLLAEAVGKTQGRRAVKTIVHVNQHKIRANVKSGCRDPVLTVKTYKDNQYGHSVFIPGPCWVRYSPDKPLPCGARVWIETESEVEVSDEQA